MLAHTKAWFPCGATAQFWGQPATTQDTGQHAQGPHDRKGSAKASSPGSPCGDLQHEERLAMEKKGQATAEGMPGMLPLVPEHDKTRTREGCCGDQRD